MRLKTYLPAILTLFTTLSATAGSIQIVKPDGSTHAISSPTAGVVVAPGRGALATPRITPPTVGGTVVSVSPKKSTQVLTPHKLVAPIIAEKPEPTSAIGKGKDTTVRIPRPQPSPPDPIINEFSLGSRLVLNDLHFEFDKYDILLSERPVLAVVARALTLSPALQVTVVGHTDNKGTAEYNLRLSKRRADSVRQALIDWFGIDGSRLITVGRGFSDPVAMNATPEGRAANRRVEIVPSR